MLNHKKYILLIVFCVFYEGASAQTYAARIAETVMSKYPDSIVVKKMLNHLIQDNQGTDPAE